MEWWRWLATAAWVVLLVLLLLLWFDSLRSRPGWTIRRAVAPVALAALGIPAGALLAVVLPVWAVIALVAVPAVVLAVLASAS